MLSPIEVLVICPLGIEFQSIRTLFSERGFRVHKAKNLHELCEETIIARFRNLDTSSLLTVCVTKTREQGILRTVSVATYLIEKFRPKLVISFGIAGLFNDLNYKLGDVCIPDTVYYYEPCKEVSHQDSSDTSSTTDDVATKNNQNAAYPYPTDRRDYTLPQITDNYKVCLDDPIASGEKLIAAYDSITKKQILNINTYMVGVEKEAAAVAEASRATPQHRRPRFVTIKGFSDFATGESKEASSDKEKSLQQNTFRLKAAQNAADYLTNFLITNSDKLEDDLPPHEVQDSEGLVRKLDSLKAILLDSTSLFPNDLRLVRALLPRNVPVIYHFSVSDDNLVSWVDIYFLLILHILQKKLNFVPHILISEPGQSQLRSDVKSGVEQLISKILKGSEHVMLWSSDIERSSRRHRDFAERDRAVDPNYFDIIKNTNLSLGNRDWSDHKTDRWLIYLIWMSRVMPVQLVLAFELRKQLYNLLEQVPALEAITVFGKILSLSSDDDELSSRFSERICGLGVLSNSISPMIDWFRFELIDRTESAIGVCEEFCRHYDPLIEEINSETPSFVPRVSEIYSALTNGVFTEEKSQHLASLPGGLKDTLAVLNSLSNTLFQLEVLLFESTETKDPL